jgi:hypothetical protein
MAVLLILAVISRWVSGQFPRPVKHRSRQSAQAGEDPIATGASRAATYGWPCVNSYVSYSFSLVGVIRRALRM